MQTCANDHAPISHDEFYCPLCAALEDTRDAEDRAAHLEQLADEIDAADVLQLIAQAEDCAARAYGAERALARLQGTIERWPVKPMARYIETVKRAAAGAQG